MESFKDIRKLNKFYSNLPDELKYELEREGVLYCIDCMEKFPDSYPFLRFHKENIDGEMEKVALCINCQIEVLDREMKDAVDGQDENKVNEVSQKLSNTKGLVMDWIKWLEAKKEDLDRNRRLRN